MKKVPAPEVVTALQASESPLPPQIQEALGELVGAAREGLLALSVGVGLGVVHELMELEVTEVVGARGRHNADRTAKCHGHGDGSLTLGGRRAPVRRPRMRTADDVHELPVKTYECFADRDPLTRAVMDRMLAGVSTRKFAAVGEEVERSSSTTSKTSVSEMFLERTATALGELMARRLEDVRLAVMMLDGLEIAERTHVVALGISTDGVKIPLGLWEGSISVGRILRHFAGENLRPSVVVNVVGLAPRRPVSLRVVNPPMARVIKTPSPGLMGLTCTGCERRVIAPVAEQQATFVVNAEASARTRPRSAIRSGRLTQAHRRCCGWRRVRRRSKGVAANGETTARHAVSEVRERGRTSPMADV
jgi:hypothetical protein